MLFFEDNVKQIEKQIDIITTDDLGNSLKGLALEALRYTTDHVNQLGYEMEPKK
jgi:hypothetical protein